MIRVRDTGHRATLNRRDMIVFEQRLVDALAGLVSFTSHSIHFPRRLDGHTAGYVKEEKKLLLPLLDPEQILLGVFVARGVDRKQAALLLALWPAVRALVTENILLYKRSLCDPVTGLFSRHYLVRCMERDLEALRELLPDPGLAAESGAGRQAGDSAAPRRAGEGLVSGGEEARPASLGTFIVRLAALRDVVREFGYQFADQLMTALADALLQVCPEQAVAARTGDSEFAVHLPSAGQKACRALAGAMVHALGQVSLFHPLKQERVGLHASVGYTLYPQDMTGSMFIRPPAEQARLVLRKARLAAALADENLAAPDQGSVMAFGKILAEGGRVLETLPMSRLVVSLGANVHAREGQRFSVWTPAGQTGLSPLYKGEIVLMDVHDNVSQAEIIHMGEPGWNIGPGDHLALLQEEQGSQARGSGGQAGLDQATGLYRHGDFLARWTEAREKTERFALALIRLGPGKEQDSPEGGGETDPFPDRSQEPDDNPAHRMAEAARLCREDMACLPEQEAMLGGRYGLNSLIFYHPAVSPEELAGRYKSLVRELKERLGLEAAVGIAPHPFLDFRKADALENSQKALEYAMLLPSPHVGLLDTLALNISADKRFSQGDTFGAIREYQRALLADDANGLAWNSLGICLAGLSRHAEAERHFARALDSDPDDAMALYNLGYMHQSQNRPVEAREHYNACLERKPGHLFAMVRLGQLAENSGDHASARKLYEDAAGLPGGQGLTFRHFARLCISENKLDEAREHLHEALLHDPQDARAMTLLAGLYLDAGEDPEMAASFARQSVSLRPELTSGWLQLARALENMGREKEAREALVKAGEAR